MPKRLPTPDPEIKQYADGTYVLRVGDIERSLGTKVWELALKKKPKVKAKIDATGELAGKLNCADIWDDYVSYRARQLGKELIEVASRGKAVRKRKAISPGTFKEIKDIWRLHLEPYWATKRLDKFGDELEDNWDEYCSQSVVVDLANHRKVFTGFLKWCRRKRYIKYVPELEIDAVDRRPRHVLKPGEIKKLFNRSKGSLLLFVAMYLFMGMRRKEIMTLRWDRIFLESDKPYLIIHKSEVKTRRGRALPINGFVLQMLKGRLAGQTVFPSPFVFPNRKDRNRRADLGGLKTAWNTCMRRCGFESGYITPHDLRATFEAYAHKATDFTDTQREKFAGAGIDVQKEHYVHFVAEDVRGLEEVVKVEGLSQILELKLMQAGKSRGAAHHETVH